MEQKEFKKLDNGTILIYSFSDCQLVEAKVSDSETVLIDKIEPHYGVYEGEFWDYKETNIIFNLIIAPDWMQELYGVI